MEKMTTDLMIFEVGKPFPGPVLQQEGPIMEMWGDQLSVVIQFPNLTTREKKIFDESFRQYSYLETSTPIPIAMWIFDFPKPFGAIEVNFDAHLADRESVQGYLQSIKNSISFFLLDRNILAGIKVVGLHHEAVRLFHSTLQKQLAVEYNQAEYIKYLTALYNYSPYELFQMGKQFQK